MSRDDDLSVAVSVDIGEARADVLDGPPRHGVTPRHARSTPFGPGHFTRTASASGGPAVPSVPRPLRLEARSTVEEATGPIIEETTLQARRTAGVKRQAGRWAEDDEGEQSAPRRHPTAQIFGAMTAHVGPLETP